MASIGPRTRVCAKCGDTLPIGEFKCKGGKGQRHSVVHHRCRACRGTVQYAEPSGEPTAAEIRRRTMDDEARTQAAFDELRRTTLEAGGR